MASSPITINDCLLLAIARGGRCLSTKYVNAHTKLLWACAEGHRWEAVPDSVKRGTWCRQCANVARGKKRRLPLEMLQKIAGERGGKCLATDYANGKVKVRWQCARGHQWEAEPQSVKHGTWCPYCAGRYPSFEDLKEIAKNRGGRCLSKLYVNCKTKLQWECAKGHQWEAVASSIKQGHWCPHCAGMARGTLEEMQGIAQERGGKCLSTEYISSDSKLLFECAAGHHWEARPGAIKLGSWCSKCVGNSLLTIRDMRQLAVEHGGKCLSAEYVNGSTKLRWECAEGHQWEAIPYSLRRGSWCPYCAGKHQTIEDMRRIAEERGGKCLSDRFIRNDEKLKWQCEKGHQWEAILSDIKQGRWCPVCAGKRHTLDELRQKAQEHGGKCLSEKFLGITVKHRWECAEGHQWEAKPDHVLRRKWCPFCQGTRPLTLAVMQEWASKKKGKCLADMYVNTKTKLLWECAMGHRWETTPDSVRSRNWCPTCSGKKRGTLEEMRALAVSRGGKCISSTYLNRKTKLRWECTLGHQWDALPGQIIKGSWCPQCSGNRRGELAEMQAIAQSREGKCLSGKYINAITKLRWECKRGHQWEARPSDIKKGNWCPECARGKTPIGGDNMREKFPQMKDATSFIRIEDTEFEPITPDIAILRGSRQRLQEKPDIITMVDEPLIVALLALLKRLNLGESARNPRQPLCDSDAESITTVNHTDYTFWEIFNAKLRHVRDATDFQKLMATRFRYQGQVYVLGQVYAELYNRYGFAVGRRLSRCAEALVAIVRLLKDGTIFKKINRDQPVLRTILDLGCGTGMLARRLIEELPAPERVVGVDINPEMLKYARVNVPATCFAAEEGSITALTHLKLSHFDAVICSYALHLLNVQEVGQFLKTLQDARPALSILALPASQGSKVQAIRHSISRALAAYADVLHYAASRFEIFFAMPSLAKVCQWVELEARGKDPAALQIAREYQGRVITINYCSLDHSIRRSGWIRAVQPPVRLVRVREHPAGYPLIEVIGPDKKLITTRELPIGSMSPEGTFNLLNMALKEFHAFPISLLNWSLVPPLVRSYADLQDLEICDGFDPKFWSSKEFARFAKVWHKKIGFMMHRPESPRVIFFRLLERMYAKWERFMQEGSQPAE